jgi:hypothetical protein
MKARGHARSKQGHVFPLDPAVVKLIDALARSLAREDDARERLETQALPVEREHLQDER